MNEIQYINFVFLELRNNLDSIRRKLNHLNNRLDELIPNATEQANETDGTVADNLKTQLVEYDAE